MRRIPFSKKHCFHAGSTFCPAVATRHPKYIADAKGWPVLGVRPAFKRARRSSIGRAIFDWPGQSKMDPHRFEDGNPSSFDPTVKVFRLERFADFKKKVKCRIAEIFVYVCQQYNFQPGTSRRFIQQNHTLKSIAEG